MFAVNVGLAVCTKLQLSTKDFLVSEEGKEQRERSR